MKDSPFQKAGSYFGILAAHTCHHKFSQIQKDLILIGLKDWDCHHSLTCHLEVGHRYVMAWEFAGTKMVVVFLHHLVLNYEWSMVYPNEGVVWSPLPVFQKGLPLKILKKQPLEFHQCWMTL